MTAAGALIALLGLLAGSFVALCAYRLPRARSVIRPASACPGCAHRLRAWENLPLLGFSLVGGRCRACKAALSPRYPLLEAATALAFWLCYRRAGPGIEFVREAFFASACLLLIATDIELRLLPDEATLGGLAAGLALAAWTGPGLPRAALAAALGGAGFWLVAFAYQRWRGREGLGWGDLKMLAFIGAFLGLKGLAVTVALATLAAALVGLAQAFSVLLGRLLRRRGWRRARRSAALYLQHAALPFGAFLGAAALPALFFTQPLWHWWLS